jgi:hypothetical protein
LGLFQAVFGYFKAQSNYDDMKKMLSTPNMENAPGFVKNMVNEKTLALTGKMLENRVPVMIIGLVGAILCLQGAFMMRKLKAQGYTYWMIGEILPIVGMAIFIGADAFSGFTLIGYIFPILFIVLYTVYRKELIHH